MAMVGVPRMEGFPHDIPRLLLGTLVLTINTGRKVLIPSVFFSQWAVCNLYFEGDWSLYFIFQ
jgi:hypothetical protein